MTDIAMVRGLEGRASGPAFRDEGVVTVDRALPIVESVKDAHSVVGEEFRLLRVKVQAACDARNLRCLGVVSALPGEGKSTVALGMALAFAREPGRRILLVETDLRRPSISRNLGVPPFFGVGDWLNGAIEYIPVRRLEPGGLFLLGPGEASLDRPEDLGSPRMDALLRAARETFDLVILDATPILPVADVPLMQDLLDGMILVVRSRTTPRDAIHDAISRIRMDKVIGAVLNDHREYRESYMNQAYQGYGMQDGSRRSRRRR